MATANEIDEIRSTLQRGLENLALSGNLKPLPLRQQVERPLLRSPVKVNGYKNDLIPGKPASFHRSLSSDNGHPATVNAGHGHPVSARSKSSKSSKSPRDGATSQIHSRSQIHSKPPTGRPRYSRPTSSKSRSSVASSRAGGANNDAGQKVQRTSSQHLSHSLQSVISPKPIYDKGDLKASGTTHLTKKQLSQKNRVAIDDSDNDSESWCDVEEENEGSEFNPLEK